MITADFFSRLLHQPELLKEVSTEDLDQLCYQYPWFGAAQLLYAAKLKRDEQVNAPQQIQKAAIFFNQSVLFGKELKLFTSMKTSPAEETVESGITNEDRLIDETDAAIDAEALVESEILKEEFSAPVSDAVLDAEALIEAETLREEKDAEINDSVLDAETILEAELMKEELDAPVTDAVLDAEILINAENEKEEHLQQSEEEIVSNAHAIIQASEAKEIVETTPGIVTKPEPVIVFEPYHTVDYFASQGIKLQEDKLGNDKLGQQVKSFTQWLKSMKKIYVEEKQELNEKEEKAVVNKASESNLQKDVITETMADVLVKQGKLPQAIELYNKLSLLHPEKSAYFASRIEELKS